LLIRVNWTAAPCLLYWKIVNANARHRADRIERFKAAIEETQLRAAMIRAGQFDVLFEESAPHRVFLYGVYDDATALEAHRATAHFKKYSETTTPMIAKRVARHMSPITFNIKGR
jgi:quinol monooxygenase YgiN